MSTVLCDHFVFTLYKEKIYIMVATDQAEKNFLTFYQNFPDFSKPNS